MVKVWVMEKVGLRSIVDARLILSMDNSMKCARETTEMHCSEYPETTVPSL